MAIIFKAVIIIVKKIIYVILINYIIISSIIDIIILIMKFKLEIDISEFIYFNYRKPDYIYKDYND